MVTCAHALQKRGFHVIASCRHPQDVQRLQDEGLTCIQLDLSDQESIEQAAQLAIERHLTDYGLFSNGAYGQAGALEDFADTRAQRTVRNEFLWLAPSCCQILPHMRERGESRIVQNSSV